MQIEIGNTRRTVVAVDNFLTNPDEVREFALKQEYREDNRYFRGHRSTTTHLFPILKDQFERILNINIHRWTEHSTNGVFQFCCGGDQLVYHSDHNKYAGVIYLTPNAPPEAGTTMYRSKATRGRTVEESLNLNPGLLDLAATEQRMYAGKLLDKTAWETVDVIGNVYNRLVLWNAKMVHAASEYFGNKKENARLFWMFFFDGE